MEPILKSQEALEVEFLIGTNEKLDKLLKEFETVKSDVYGGNGNRNDRLAQIEQRISNEEVSRKTEEITTRELV